MSRKRSTGFTLIEIMVVVAVVAILAAVALPAFNDQVRKSRRAEAISNLQDVQLRLERWRVDHADYTGMTARPANTAFYGYTVTTAAATPNNYTITATPVAGSSQAKDTCGTLSIAKAGATIARTPVDAKCW